eukprot:770131_1
MADEIILLRVVFDQNEAMANYVEKVANEDQMEVEAEVAAEAQAIAMDLDEHQLENSMNLDEEEEEEEESEAETLTQCMNFDENEFDDPYAMVIESQASETTNNSIQSSTNSTANTANNPIKPTNSRWAQFDNVHGNAKKKRLRFGGRPQSIIRSFYTPVLKPSLIPSD